MRAKGMGSSGGGEAFYANLLKGGEGQWWAGHLGRCKGLGVFGGGLMMRIWRIFSVTSAV